MTKAEAIEKIRKLRRLADGGAGPAEAASARRIADELAKLHEITAADLEGAAGGGGGKAGFTDDFDFGFGRVSFHGGGVKVTVGGTNVEGDLDDFLSFLYRAAREAPSSAPQKRRHPKGHAPPKAVTVDAITDHQKNPNRVHLAVNNMRSVCGIGPTFVFTYERAIAIRSGEPCPHCMETGVIDARQPQLRLPAHRLRDARGRWI